MVFVVFGFLGAFCFFVCGWDGMGWDGKRGLSKGNRCTYSFVAWKGEQGL
jgi:hypothetical protein